MSRVFYDLFYSFFVSRLLAKYTITGVPIPQTVESNPLPASATQENKYGISTRIWKGEFFESKSESASE